MIYNILIADDMLLNRKLIRKALNEKIDNAAFYEAENGEKALQHIFNNRVDIVILDLIMPEKDGFEVLKEVKALKDYRDIPIIVNSAMDEIQTIEKALELGANDYFTKPLTMQQMEIVLPVKVKNALIAYEQKRLLLDINRRMTEELRFANVLQTMLIDDSKSLRDVEMVGKYIPSSELSGDFYECVQVGDRVWLFIADVSGHGVAAAMISSMMKVMFKNIVRQYSTPKEVLREMNSTFFNLTRGAYYITAFLGLIEDGVLTYSNGGHPYPVVIDSSTNRPYMLEDNGFIVGVMEDYEYEMHSIEFNSGDYIIMYTDGLLESEGPGQPIRSCDDFLEYIIDHKDIAIDNPKLLLESVIKDFGKDRFDTLRDDVALLMIKKK
ncbi:MAG TPA: fused response regulator/phosphatase [Clostridia bacterium]|nr:fused response regulator/phosphatase [Clostridia bacterium]